MISIGGDILPKQAGYLNSKSPIAIYAGGVGAGKSIANFALTMKLLIENPGIDLLSCAPTYGMLQDTTIWEFKQRCPDILIEDFREGIYPRAKMRIKKHGKASTVRFRAFDMPGKSKSITVGSAIIEEATEVKEDILDEVMRRVRQGGMPNYHRWTTNSDSKRHYLYTRYVQPFEEGKIGKDEVDYIQTTSFENTLLPENYLIQLKRLEKQRPGHYMQKVLGMWGDFDDGAIGAFPEIDGFSTAYRVAFIDSSFSDRSATDRTAVSIVAFSPLPGKDQLYWPIEFTGQSWEKSVTNDDVIVDMLRFLDIHRPIETVFESQLGDSTKVFIDRFREVARALGLVQNHWTVFHQSKNKHERIMFNVAGNHDRISVLRGTDPTYLGNVAGYIKGAKHEDEIDSLAGAIHQWSISEILQEYIYLVERK